MLKTFLTSIVFLNISSLLAEDPPISIDYVLKNLVNSTYISRLRPSLYDLTGTLLPVNVSISLYIGSFQLNVKKEELSIQMYLREHWMDPRLAYRDKGEIIPPNVQFTKKSNEDLIWMPDTFIKDQKISKTTHSKHSLIKLWPDGALMYSRFLTVTIPCSIDYTLYPMVNVSCLMSLESYGYSTSDLDLQWLQKTDPPVSWASDGISPKNFILHEIDSDKKVEHYATGNYTTLSLKIQFERIYGSDFFKIYIPSTMIVCTSWISFWVHRNHLAAKTMISISTMLMMLILSSSTTGQIPETPYAKAIDYWIGVCYLFIFMSLVELGLVAYLDQRKRAREANKHDGDTLLGQYEAYNKRGNQLYHGSRTDLPNMIDIISRIAFPFGFFMFVGLYKLHFGA